MIKTNELPSKSGFGASDSFLVDMASGTGRLSGTEAAEFMKEVFLRGSIRPFSKELSESWASLKGRISTGDFSGIHIGDYKKITLTTGEVVIMEVAGIDQYYNHGDTAIGHHVDFISRDALKGGKRMNATATNNGNANEKNPWLASELYKTLNDESTGIYSKLPSDLKPCIITKRAVLEERYSAGGAVAADTGKAWGNAGKLWLPTEVEVFGYHVWSDPQLGTGGGCNLQYPIFRYNGVIKGNGNGGYRCYWWELSAERTNDISFCNVGGNGNAYSNSASNTGVRVPLCFRIG